jgi:hypothetical protein
MAGAARRDALIAEGKLPRAKGGAAPVEAIRPQAY